MTDTLMNMNEDPEDSVPAIAIVPYRKWPTWNMSKVSLDDLEWPLGRPSRLARGAVSRMRAQDHLITFPRKPLFWLPRPGVRAKVSLMIVEPDAIHGGYQRLAALLNRRFFRILTRNRELLGRIDNGIFFHFGSTSIRNPEALKPRKSRMASLIASARRELEGHRLRHEVAADIRSRGLDVDVMGRGYTPFERKEEGLLPYRYSVVIENVREADYFTEKIVDACLCETVPIYWGAPNIGEYFDPRGMIICNSREEIRAALAKISPEDYRQRLEWIRNNRVAALEHARYRERAARLVRESMQLEQTEVRSEDV